MPCSKKDFATAKFAQVIADHGPDSVGFYISGQLLTEDYYVFNKLAKGLIGTNNVDTNSRLCMSSAVEMRPSTRIPVSASSDKSASRSTSKMAQMRSLAIASAARVSSSTMKAPWP